MRLSGLLPLSIVLLMGGCALTQPRQGTVDPSLSGVKEVRTMADAGAVGLEWNPSDDARVAGYRIYRSTAANDGFVAIGDVSSRFSSHYVDSDAAVATPYYYRVTAVASDGAESAPVAAAVTTLARPEGVSYVETVKGMPKQIKVIWRPHPNPATASYKILRADPRDNNKWETVGTVRGRLAAEYIDTNLDEGRIYQYRVVAVMFNGVESLPSATVEGTTKIPLPYPGGLTATHDLPRAVALSWSAVPQAAFYKLYRSSFQVAGYEPVKVSDLNYTDAVADDGATRYYKVAAVSADGYEGLLSPVAVQGATLAKPAAPKLASNSLENGRVVIRWSEGDGRAVAYKVARRAYNGPMKTKLIWDEIVYSGLTQTMFVDANLSAGGHYGYFVYAVDRFGIVSEPSSEAEVTLPDPAAKGN